MTAIALGMPAPPVARLAERRRSRRITVGSVPVGGDAPVSVQSMCTTKTADVNATLQQIAELTAAGCQIVRVAVPDTDDVAAQPASIAANTYRGWKWMSAITGICDLAAIAGSAATSSVSGTATRTIWQPAAVSSAICCRVALTSAVFVVHIDWTETGASPPTGTEPTVIRRDRRRSASRATGGAGIPNAIAVIAGLPSSRTRSHPNWLGMGSTMSA